MNSMNSVGSQTEMKIPRDHAAGEEVAMENRDVGWAIIQCSQNLIIPDDVQRLSAAPLFLWQLELRCN